jgi:methionyl-tRNA formyltransferase
MGYRIAIISNVFPLVEPLAERLRELGHEPVTWLLARGAGENRPEPPWGEVTDSSAPKGLSVLLAQDKQAVALLLRGLELDVTLCWGFSWKLPQEALDVPRLGSVNQHPGQLPRHRGPFPLAWALREGEGCSG